MVSGIIFSVCSKERKIEREREFGEELDSAWDHHPVD